MYSYRFRCAPGTSNRSKNTFLAALEIQRKPRADRSMRLTNRTAGKGTCSKSRSHHRGPCFSGSRPHALFVDGCASSHPAPPHMAWRARDSNGFRFPLPFIIPKSYDYFLHRRRILVARSLSVARKTRFYCCNSRVRDRVVN